MAARLVETRCASTLCRAEMPSDDGLKRDQLLETIKFTEPLTTKGLIRQRGEADGTVVLFLTRPGEAL